jgi:hypothetical protein
MALECSLPCSQEPATCLGPETDECNSRASIHGSLFKIHFEIIFVSAPISPKFIVSFDFFLLGICMHCEFSRHLNLHSLLLPSHFERKYLPPPLPQHLVLGHFQYVQDVLPTVWNRASHSHTNKIIFFFSLIVRSECCKSGVGKLFIAPDRISCS